MSKLLKNKQNENNEKRITAEQTIILIRLIRKYKILWDPNHPDFRKTGQRNEIYEKIGRYFQLSGADIQRKFYRLRNGYRHELKQIYDKKKQCTSLFYYDEMEFLKEQVVQRLLNSKLGAVSPTSSNKEDGDSEVLAAESFEEFYTVELTDFPNPSNEMIMTTDALAEELEVEQLESDEEKQYADEESLSKEKTDEFDVFAAFLASQLRAMDKLSALETMEELQHIISRRRINALKESLRRDCDAKPYYRYSLKKSKLENE